MPSHSVRFLILIGLIVLPSSCGQDTPASGHGVRRNVILVSIDTLRWDRLGCTGHTDAATPRLDALAREGTLYPNSVAATPLTLPSHATMLSGLLPVEHGVRDNPPAVFPRGQDTLATTLGDRGYRTYAVIAAAPLAPGCGLEAGFDIYDYEVNPRPTGTVALDERNAEQVTDRALSLLKGQDSTQPFFLFVHYFDPHAPYAPPPSFANQFPDSPYDGEIAFVDQQIGRLIDGLEQLGMMEDTILAITADHGESLGDHGEEGHGFFIHDATIRVPLILIVPGEPGGQTDDEQVRLQDLRWILETLAQGEHASPTRPAAAGEPALIESLYGWIHCDFAQLRGLRTPGGLKFLEACDEEFYVLAEDPDEIDNQIGTEDSRIGEARDALRTILLSSTRSTEVGNGEPLPGYLSTPRRNETIFTLNTEENCRFASPASHASSIAALHRGNFALEGGLFESACQILQQGVEADPGNPALQFWLGRALYRASGTDSNAARLNRSSSHLERTLELRPHHQQARDLLIYVLTQLGRYGEAKNLGEQARTEGLAGPKTLEALAILHLTTQGARSQEQNPFLDPTEGLKLLEKAIEASGDHPAPQLETRLQQARQALRPIPGRPGR